MFECRKFQNAFEYFRVWYIKKNVWVTKDCAQLLFHKCEIIDIFFNCWKNIEFQAFKTGWLIYWEVYIPGVLKIWKILRSIIYKLIKIERWSLHQKGGKWSRVRMPNINTKIVPLFWLTNSLFGIQIIYTMERKEQLWLKK